MTQQIPPKMTVGDIARTFTVDELFEALKLKMNYPYYGTSWKDLDIPPAVTYDRIQTYSYQARKDDWNTVEIFKKRLSYEFRMRFDIVDLFSVREIQLHSSADKDVVETYYRGTFQYITPINQ